MLEDTTTTTREEARARPVVHVEVIGTDPAGLRDYDGSLFGWELDTRGEVAREVSVPDVEAALVGVAALP
jgi:hypothetical protein